MTIVITGSEGFIGQALRTECERAGMQVAGIDVAAVDRPGYINADIGSKALANVMPEADALVHLAGLSRQGDCKGRLSETIETNILATLNLIEIAQNRGIRQFIFASTEWVYGEHQSDVHMDEDATLDILSLKTEYAFSKLAAEAALRMKIGRGFDNITILRFGIIYGPKERNFGAVESIFESIRNSEEVRIGSRRTGRFYVHVSDIAKGILKSVGLTGLHTINLAGDRLSTLGEVIENSERILGRRARVLETAPELFNVRGVSSEKAGRLIGWRPELALEAGLRTLMRD